MSDAGEPGPLGVTRSPDQVNPSSRRAAAWSGAADSYIRLMSDTRMQLVEVAPGEFKVSGEVDAHSAESFGTALTTVGDQTTAVMVDMSDVTFMDSSGLRVLVEAQQRAESGGPSLVLRSPSRQITRLLDLTGLTENFQIETPA